MSKHSHILVQDPRKIHSGYNVNMTNTRLLPKTKLNRHLYFKILFTVETIFKCMFLWENFDALDFIICSKKKLYLLYC